MKVRRSRRIAAPQEAVWNLATDPHHLPRWWPATQRVESVTRAGWTSVAMSPRGRTVRADYSVATTEPRSLARWRQDLDGTPFERLFASVTYELRFAPAEGGQGTDVTIEVDQEPRGWARFGGFQLRAAAKRQLSTALENLAGLAEEPKP